MHRFRISREQVSVVECDGRKVFPEAIVIRAYRGQRFVAVAWRTLHVFPGQAFANALSGRRARQTRRRCVRMAAAQSALLLEQLGQVERGDADG